MATFEKMRVSLALIDKTPMYNDQEEPKRSRTQFLIDAFASRLDFLPSRGKSKVTFFPINSPEGYVAGFFGKEVHQKGRKGPEDKFTETDIERWEISLFILNLDEGSQVSWMQLNSEVGSPKSMLESFFKNLSKNSSFGEWQTHVKHMDTEGYYWDAIKNHKQAITKLDFKFIPPNALKLTQKVADFVKLADEQGHPDTQQHIYKASAGKMEPESDILAASAEVAMQGGGEVKVYVGSKKVYDSDDERTTKDINDDELPTPTNPTFLKRVIDILWPS